MLDYARIFGLRTVVFRHSLMYGGRQFASYDQGWIGWFCQKALEIKRGTLKEPFTISGNGKQVRDVLHAEDMKRLYFAAVEHIDQTTGKAFNIGGGMGNSRSLLELFGVMCSFNQTKQRLTVVFDKGMNSEEAIHSIDDNARIHFITTYSTYFVEELAGTDLRNFVPLDIDKNRSLRAEGHEEECMLAFRSQNGVVGSGTDRCRDFQPPHG